MNVYKINDVINCEFLKIPKSMFAKEDYRKLSSCEFWEATFSTMHSLW